MSSQKSPSSSASIDCYPPLSIPGPSGATSAPVTGVEDDGVCHRRHQIATSGDRDRPNAATAGPRMDPAVDQLAERVGFEPTVRLKADPALAVRSIRPGSGTSPCSSEPVNLVPPPTTRS